MKTEIKGYGSSNKTKKTSKLLIIDNEEKICNIVKNDLVRKGYNAKYALNENNAIDLIRREYFSVIFLNIMIPGMNGLGFVRRIRNKSPLSQIIITSGELIDIGEYDDLINKNTNDMSEADVSLWKVS